METIKVKNNEYVLMPAEYIQEIRDLEPVNGMFSMDADIHIKNVGKIICYPEINDEFGLYEPVSNEYELDEVYDYLDNQVEEKVVTAAMLKSARRSMIDPLMESKHMSFSLFKRLNESIEDVDQDIKDEAFERILSSRTQFKGYYASVGISRYSDEYCTNANKMEEYIRKGSSPTRVAGACKNNLEKLLNRYAYLINYRKDLTDWIDIFKETIKNYVYSHNDWNISFRRTIEEINKERAAKAKFEDDVNNADTSKFAPKARDWEKMIDYMNRKSVPQRLADSCKDGNKVVARFIIANSLGWTECADAFKKRAISLGIASAAELEAYARKYATAGMPEEYAELVQDIKSNDLKGGLAMYDKDSVKTPRYVTKALDDCSDIVNYNIKKVNNSDYEVTAMTVNDTEIVFKLTPSYSRTGQNKYTIEFRAKNGSPHSLYSEQVWEFNQNINRAVSMLM